MRSFQNKKLKQVAIAAMVAALYVVLTGISALCGLDKGVIQFRLSEVLTVLPFFSFASVPGLFLGCLLSGLLFGSIPIDIIFGSLATLAAGFVTYFLGKRFGKKFMACIPPILFNTAVVPLILKYAYMLDGFLPFFALTVFIGEAVTAGIIGTVLLYKLPKSIINILKDENKNEL